MAIASQALPHRSVASSSNHAIASRTLRVILRINPGVAPPAQPATRRSKALTWWFHSRPKIDADRQRSCLIAVATLAIPSDRTLNRSGDKKNIGFAKRRAFRDTNNK